MGFLSLFCGRKAADTVGNGRNACEDGNDEFRLGSILLAAPPCADSAKGEETEGRDMVNEDIFSSTERRRSASYS